MGDIIVHVMDTKGEPIPGAVVSAKNIDAWTETIYRGTTDLDGFIEFEGVDAGTVGDHYEISVIAEINGNIVTGQAYKQIGPFGLGSIKADIILSPYATKTLGDKSIISTSQKLSFLRLIGIKVEQVERDKKTGFSIEFDFDKKLTIPIEIKDAYEESIKAFINEIDRACWIMSSTTIELALKYKYKELENKDFKGDFFKLINWAHDKQIIDKNNKNFANTLRTLGNINKHEFTDEGLTDTHACIQLTKKIIEKIFTN